MNRDENACRLEMLPVLDAMYVLQGKWKLPILLALTFQSQGFKALERSVIGITPRMLSKELKHLEENQLIERTVLHTNPVKIEYSLTEHGKTLKTVILSLRDWGIKHRKTILKE